MKKFSLVQRSHLWSASLLALVLLMLASADAAAHVRWFVDPSATVETFEPYRLTDAAVLVWIAVALLLIGASVALDMRLPNVRIVDTKTRHDFIELLRVFTGMAMLLTAYEGAIIAPHLIAFGPFGTFLLFLRRLGLASC